MLAGQVAADYRGSEYYSYRFLPLPYFMYHSPVIKIDRNGARGEFWRTKGVQLNISLDGAIGGEDKNNPYRKGMEPLESAVEFGPSLDFLIGGASFENGVSLRLPFRGVFSVGKSGIDHVGYLFNPRLTWRKPQLIGQWRASMSFGLLYADKQYHNYFYQVKPSQALSWRPVYEGASGYSGAYIRMNWYRLWQDWRFGISMRYDYLSGAVFMDSPIFETKHYGSVAFVIIRKFWSKTLD